MSGARSSAAFFTNSASASRGRAMLTMSAQPSARISSATSGVLIRLVVISGTVTSPLSFFVTQA